MTPFDEERGIVEIDGPQQAYFEIPIHRERGWMLRILYVTVVRKDRNKKRLVESMADQLEWIRQALLKEGGGVIWWRKRPAIEKDKSGLWTWHARFATTPELSDEVWKSVDVAKEYK